MKLVLTVIAVMLTVSGVLLLILAGIYFFLPADVLPNFLPGHDPGLSRIHAKHGIVYGVAGIVLIGVAVFLGRK